MTEWWGWTSKQDAFCGTAVNGKQLWFKSEQENGSIRNIQVGTYNLRTTANISLMCTSYCNQGVITEISQLSRLMTKLTKWHVRPDQSLRCVLNG